MNLRQISIVYRKELLDALRDKRTIISTIVIPIVMFPVIFLSFGALASKSVKKVQSEQSPVMVIGAENSPALVERIKKESSLSLAPFSADYVARISEKKIRAAVEFPNSLESRDGTNLPVVKIYHYAGEIRSQIAVKSLQNIVRDFRDEMVERTLGKAGLSKAELKPFETLEENVAPATKVGGNLLGGFIPYLIIFMSFVGCMAPALDLTAGEKERGTIETILASPIGRTELVLGKFLLVVTASILTTVVALLSNTITLMIPLLATREMSKGGSMPFDLSLPGLFGVFMLVIPVAISFAAVQLAIASFARNYREAQSYLSPLMMVIMVPSMAALLPGLDLTLPLAFIPILNVSLVSKEILSGVFHWGLISVVFLSSTVYAMAALAAAIAAFKSESVLFRT